MNKSVSFAENRRNSRHKLVRDALTLRSGDLGRRVVSGAGFTFLGIALRTLLTIGSMSILARLLSPSDFGYIAMATVITELAGLLGSFGLANILIQRKVVTRLQLDTVFWASLTIGLAIATLVAILSFATSWIFADELTGELLRVLCLTFIFGSLTTVHEALLARLMRFRTDFIIQISAIAIRSGSAILFAYTGFGVWSLVAGSIIGSISTALFFLLTVPYFPRLRFHLQYILSSWKTSSSYLGNTILYYINMNIDVLLIGRQFGASALGVYQNARSLTDEVRGRIAMPLQRVLFPAFSAIQADHQRLQQSVLRSARLLAAIIFPIGIGLSAVAPELVPVLYGNQWLSMIPILSMLGISAAIRGSTAIASPLFNSQNQVALSFRYNVISTVLLVTSVISTLSFGLQIVAAAIAANAAFSIITFRVAFGLIGLRTRHVLKVLTPPTAASSVMWATISLLRQTSINYDIDIALVLPLLILSGAISYSISLIIISREYFSEFTILAKKLLNKG